MTQDNLGNPENRVLPRDILLRLAGAVDADGDENELIIPSNMVGALSDEDFGTYSEGIVYGDALTSDLPPSGDEEPMAEA